MFRDPIDEGYKWIYIAKFPVSEIFCLTTGWAKLNDANAVFHLIIKERFV